MSVKIISIILILLSLVGISFAQSLTTQIPLFVKSEELSATQQGKKISKPQMSAHPEYDVLLYDIRMDIFPDSQKIQATTSIRLAVTMTMTENLLFDFASLQIDSVILDAEKVPASRNGEILVIDLDSPLMVGDTHQVAIYYQGTPEKGLYFRLNGYDDLIIYSHNEPHDARYWFPCKDDPSDKAKLLMTVTLPDKFVVLSNGTLIESGESGYRQKRYIWQEDYPIATYLISIAAGPYLKASDSFEWQGDNLLLEYYVYPNDLSRGAAALKLVKEMLDFYSSYIGNYPFFSDKYSMSEVPFREASAMENQTATTMGDFVMDNEEVIAHELAHQWWGDALTPHSFVDIWLNEGFATYFDALFTEYAYGREAFLKRMDDFYNFLVSDGSLNYPIYNPPPPFLFGRAVYMKGAWVLHMLRSEVGDQIFNEIIQHYYQTYNYLNVTSTDFIEVVESVSGKSFEQFFDQWLFYGGMPLLLGSWEQKKNVVTVSINQEQPEPVYQFDLEVLIEGVLLDTLLRIPITDRHTQVTADFAEPVTKILIDPYNKILNTNNSPVYFIPKQAAISRISPNPFSETVMITYQMEKNENVVIAIYDIIGKQVEQLVDEKKNTGIHQVEWNGNRYASGVYICIMTVDGTSDMRKMILVK
jgi:aminopeptidase N